MQGVVLFRSVAASVLIAGLAACSSSHPTSSGQTPLPAQTSLAQAGATRAPDNAKTRLVKTHYTITSAKTSKGITFSVYVNGQPGPSLNTAGGSTDITNLVGVGHNTIVVRWKKETNTGAGTLTITANGKPLMAEMVRPKDAVTGQKSVSVSAK
ncbi:MAG: hypothetical protein M3R35_03070 [Candidatus Eremiobacteraeota bacterium]|nr:hypothetical protein [Candidatus Eremiobacteraeota bacterium]